MAKWEAQVGPYQIGIEGVPGIGAKANDEFFAALCAIQLQFAGQGRSDDHRAAAVSA